MITEYPTEISLILYGENNNGITFSEDGKSVILTLESVGFCDLQTQDGIKYYLNYLVNRADNFKSKSIENYEIGEVTFNKNDNTYQVSVSLPDEIVLSDEYIEDEIKNIGRVYTRNVTGNKYRYLMMYSNENNFIERNGDRLFVNIERFQTVPSVLVESRRVKMSERQITRNIKNRLWNKVDVKCISLDDRMYYGEIITS